MIAQHVFQALAIIALVVLVPLLYVRWRAKGGVLNAKQWTWLAVLILLAGLLGRIPAITLLAALALFALGIGWLWHKAILANVRYTCDLRKTHLFPGEETCITWTIQNDKWLPIGFLRWQEPLPVHTDKIGNRKEGVQLTGVEIRPIFDGQADGIDEVISLGAHQTLIRTGTVKALRRGFYQFGPVELQASDALGLYTAAKRNSDGSTLVVYPRLYTLGELTIPAIALLPDMRQRRSLVDDPSWYRGVRHYQPADPLKQIDWNITARTRQLHVKLFEPVAQPKLMVIAHLYSFERTFVGCVASYMESVISTAASIVWWALDTGFEVGLLSNGVLAKGEAPIQISPAATSEQLSVILDQLGRLTYVAPCGAEDLLEIATANLPPGSSLVVCSGIVTDAMTLLLANATRQHHTVLVLVDTDLAPYIPNLTVVYARTPGEVAA